MSFRARQVCRRSLTTVAVATLLATGAPTPVGARDIVGPPPGVPFQYQLQTSSRVALQASGGIDVNQCSLPVLGGVCVRAKVFSIDLYGPNGATPNAVAVRAIRRARGYAICYVDAGTWEAWRPDASAFASSLLGRSNGWPGERWLDIRHASVLLGIMARRVAQCEYAGFAAVDFDNVDAYRNDTGFAITATEQLFYDRALATLAHRDHLAAGLKNDRAQARALEPWFDFAIDEQCVQYHACAALTSFVSAGKPVYDVEYVGRPSTFCRLAPRGVDVTVKALSLFARPWRPCR